MTIHVSQVQRLRCYQEPNGSLGTDHTATLGDFFDVPAIEGTVEMTLEQPMVPSMYLRQDRDDHAVELLGPKKATLTFSCPIFLPDSRSAVGVTLVASPAMTLLETYLGGEYLGISDENAAGSTTTVLAQDSGADFAEGKGAAWADTLGVLYAREVVKVATNDVTLGIALPSAPAENDLTIRSGDYYMGSRTSTNVKTFQFLVEGVDNDYDCWVLLGGQCVTAPTLELKIGERPMIKWTIEFANWNQKSSLLSGISTVTYSNVQENFLADSTFYCTSINTAAPSTPVSIPTALNISEISFDLSNYKYMPIKSPGGTNNTVAYIVDGASPKATIKFKMPLDDAAAYTYLGYRDNSTLVRAVLQIGSSETNGCILITANTCQVTDWVRVTANGIVEQEVTLVARADVMHDTAQSSATEIAKSPVKIHIF